MTPCHELGEYSVEVSPKCFPLFQLAEYEAMWSKLLKW